MPGRRKAVPKEKLTVALSPVGRHKLSVIKADLRLKGLSVAEGDVLDALIKSTSTEDIIRLLKRR